MAVMQALLRADNEHKVTKFDLRSENGDSDTAAHVYHLAQDPPRLDFQGEVGNGKQLLVFRLPP